jgi:hypothetical protein
LIRNRAILDATKLSNYNIGGGRSIHFIKDGIKIQKLGKWLEKSRKNETNLLPLLHQLHKVKVVSITEHEPILVRLGDHSETKIAEMMKERTRFVIPDSG